MADLNIRNVPSELLRGLKLKAAKSEMTLRELCLGVLSLAIQSPENGDRGVGAEWEQNKARTQQNAAEALQTPPLDKERSPELPAGEVGKPQEAPKRPRTRKATEVEPEHPETSENEDYLESLMAEVEPEVQIEMCDYKEYDDQVGEWFGCRLPVHGPKVKHQRGEKA